jgi:hypothetical protein
MWPKTPLWTPQAVSALGNSTSMRGGKGLGVCGLLGTDPSSVVHHISDPGPTAGLALDVPWVRPNLSPFLSTVSLTYLLIPH